MAPRQVMRGILLPQWKRGVSGEAIDCLKTSYRLLENVGSPNLNVIAASARLELAQLYLQRQQDTDCQDAAGEIQQALAALRAFNR